MVDQIVEKVRAAHKGKPCPRRTCPHIRQEISQASSQEQLPHLAMELGVPTNGGAVRTSICIISAIGTLAGC